MNPSNAQLVKDVYEAIYDTYAHAAGALPLSIPLFVTPADGVTKGIEDTNMTLPNGQLPNPEQHMIYSVRVEFINTAKADAIGLNEHYCVSVSLNGAEQVTSPISFFPGAGGERNDEGNGVADPRACLSFTDETRIEWTQGSRLSVKLLSLAGFAPGAAIKVRVHLVGLHTKNVG